MLLLLLLWLPEAASAKGWRTSRLRLLGGRLTKGHAGRTESRWWCSSSLAEGGRGSWLAKRTSTTCSGLPKATCAAAGCWLAESAAS